MDRLSHGCANDQLATPSLSENLVCELVPRNLIPFISSTASFHSGRNLFLLHTFKTFPQRPPTQMHGGIGRGRSADCAASKCENSEGTTRNHGPCTLDCDHQEFCPEQRTRPGERNRCSVIPAPIFISVPFLLDRPHTYFARTVRQSFTGSPEPTLDGLRPRPCLSWL